MIDVFTKYALGKPLKDKKFKTVFNDFIGIVNEFKRKPNKLWLDQERKFHDSLMQKWLYYNDVLMYLTYDKGNSVVAEGFIRASKDKMDKKVTTCKRSSYLDYLGQLIDECNKTYPRSVGKNTY